MPNELYRFYIGGSLAGVAIYPSWSPSSPLPPRLHGLEHDDEYVLTHVELRTPQGDLWRWMAYRSQTVPLEQVRMEIQQYIIRRSRGQNHSSLI